MIASFSNNFIFLKTRKTAGTSVSIVLSTWCDRNDVLSPIYAPDEALREELGAPPSVASYNGVRIHPHMTARVVQETFPELWDRAYKLSIERHPYEKAVSRAFWDIGKKGGDPVLEFQEALNHSVESANIIDRDIYCLDGKVVVNQIIDQKNIEHELAKLSKRFGKEMPVIMPRAKSQFRIDNRPAKEILSAKQKLWIQEVCDFEFQHFNFEK